MTAGSLPFAPSLAAFESAIDRACEPAQSIVLRYRGVCRFEGENEGRFRELLKQTSLREGLRIVPLLRYRDVAVDVLDSTSRMHTRTHKSVDGCVTTARCLLRGQRRIVFESGGNTGTALTAYATRAGIETFLFLPADNLALLDAALFEHPAAHLIAVDDARDVKPAAAAFAARFGLARVPEVAWRHQAATFIGCFVLEQLLANPRYDHLVQGISAAFAPIGIYRVLEPFREALGGLPRFLGVQQAANCPMLGAWKGTQATATPLPSTSGLLAKVMYDGAPQTYGTYDELSRLLRACGGDLTSLDAEDFTKWLTLPLEGRTALEHLSSQGLPITERDGEPLEKAGLMGLAATLRAIASRQIAPGSRVLVNVTGGTASPRGPAQPEARLGPGESYEPGAAHV